MSNWVKNTWNYKNGKLFWKERRRGLKDITRPAGTLSPDRYCRILFEGNNYKRSRLVFFYFHNRWPKYHIDHINRNQSDDRIENLREASHSLSQINRGIFKSNKIHVKYITKRTDVKNSTVYRFHLQIKRKHKYIKSSNCLSDLIAFRDDYLKKYHPLRFKCLNNH